MGFSLSAAIFALLQVCNEPLGDLTKGELLNHLSDLGYSTTNWGDQFAGDVSNGTQSLRIEVAIGSSTPEILQPVSSASVRIEFDLPRTLENRKLLAWQVKEKLEKLKLHSFLGGKVVMQGNLFYRGQTLGNLGANIRNLFGISFKLKQELGKLGAKQSEYFYQTGRAPLDLNARLEFVEQEDLDYLREQMRWGKRIAASVIRGWCTGAEPMGIPVCFSGVAGSRPGFFMACFGRPESKKLERWERTASQAEREDVLVQDGYVHIQNWLDTTGGLTIREVVAKILEFTRRVKALDLF